MTKVIVKLESVTYMDGYDDCLVGHVLRCGSVDLALYSIEKLVERHQKDGMTAEEAIEFVHFNQLGAWVGDGTPVFLAMED